jgi:TP901 family phage tail tape measure protein
VSDVRSTFSYDANFGPAQTQIRSLVKDITVLNAAFKSLDNEANKVRNARAGSFMSSLGNVGGFNAQIVDLTSDVERFGKALQKNQLTLRQYYKEAAQAYKKNSMARRLAEDEVRRAQSQLIGMGQNKGGRQQGMLVTPLTIDTSDINTKMAISQKQFSIFNKLVNDGATQLINWGKNTQWAGRQLTVGLTVPLTIFGAAVSKTFREVDKELTRFAKVYGSDLVGANQQATNTMRSQVEQLSKDFAGKYGIAAKETAGLAADLAATGLEGQKLLDSVAQTTRLAVLGEVDRQEAMKATLALQGAFNMSTTELAESINFLNAVENQTSASLQDLTEAIPRVGPVINSLGGDVKDLAVLLVAMKEGGVNAAEGANAIKSGLASLINPTRQASETAKQYGIDLDGIVKANKGKLMPTIMAFQEALSGLDEFAKAQIIEQLFGKYQFARISALFDNLNASGSQTVEVLKLMGASSQDLAKIANGEIRTLTESSSMRFQRSMEAIKASLIPVGQVLTDSVIPFLEKTANLIQMLVEYASNLPGPVKSFLKVATGFTLVAGPLIMLAGVFGNFLGYITKSAMSITKLGAALAGLRTEKFEMLDDTQLAASKASDVLTSGYNNQRSSLDKLNIAMEAYLANLREEVTLSGQLFVPGTKTSGRGPKGGKKAKLAEGGQPYVPGSGDGDKVPALLEPGEFVVNKKAAAKYGPLLEDINFNRSPRFQKGGHSGPGSNLTDFIRLQKGGSTEKLANKTILRIRKNSVSDQKAQALESFVLRGMDKYKDSPSEFKKFIASLTAELEALDKQGKKYNTRAVLGEPAKQWVLDSGVSRARPSRQRPDSLGAPSEIQAERKKQKVSEKEDAAFKELKKNQKSLGISDRLVAQMAKINATHLTPEIDPITGQKIYRMTNTAWIPAAENIGLQYLMRERNKIEFEKALTQAASELKGVPVAEKRKYIEEILNGKHPISGKQREMFLNAMGIASRNNKVSTGARSWAAAAALLKYTPEGTIASKADKIQDPITGEMKENDTPYARKTGVPKSPRKVTGGSPTKQQRENHPPTRRAKTKGGVVNVASNETLAVTDYVDAKMAEDGIRDGQDIKAQKKAIRGQKAGAIGGLAMTAAFTLPAITGTNEALNGLTNNLLIASSAISAFATIAQVRGIGGGGMGMGAKARNLKNASMAYRGVAPQRIPVGMEGAGRSLSREAGIAQAKQQVGAGRVMGAVATKAGGAGKGAALARGALSTVGLLGGPVGIALVAAIALGTAAFVAYQKAINNARKEGASLFAEQTKAAEYYGIELKTINSAMLENAKIAKDMGFAAAGAAVTVDPELKKAILEQEENKKLVEQLKESSDPASIFLGQYGKMLQQGFNPEQAKEVLSVLAQASGQMGGLTRVSSQINGITTPEQATAAIGESFTSNIGSLFGDNSTIWDTELANAEGRFGELIKAGLTSSDLSEGFKIIEDGIAAAYKEGASKGLSDKDISDTLNKSFSTQLEGMGFKEGDEVYDTINNLGDSLEDTRLKAALVQATAAQIDLSKFIEDLDVSKAKAEELYLVLASTDALASTNTRAIADAQRVIDEIDKEIQVRTAYFDQLAVNNENAQASEEERTKNFQKNIEKRNKAIQKEIKGIQKAADEQIKTKEKEIDAIEESSDKYLKALQSQKDESSFLASQQQTALGGLGALASGDVIGFLQARDEMASAAQSNAQEEEIKKIEDLTDARVTDIEKTIDAIKEKADAEVGTLQDQLEKNQELMDKEGERHENRMAALQKEAIQIQTNKSAEIKAFDDSKAALQEFINTPVGDKLGKDLTKYAEAISNVAANMPAHSKNIMNDLATSFGNNFQSVFDAEVQKSAEEFGVDPTDLKTLVQKSLPKNGGSGVKASDRFAKGGYVSGPGTGTSDSISAQLSNGEYVVKADSVKRIGKDTLDRINAGTGGMITRTSTTEGYRVGGGEAITAAAAFAGGVKTAVSAITSANALVKAAASAMNEEPENSDGGGTGKTTSIPEQLGKVARILRGTYKVSARGTYPSGNPHSARYGTAIDYATPTGTGVYAMAGGTASNLNKGNSSFGKYVTIKHADGTESLYAHLDSHGQGGTVNAGDFIGETGNTGNSTGPHLHFEWSALKNGFNPPGMRIGGETMSDGLANLHKGELVLTKPLTQQLKDGIGELKFGMPSASGVSPIDSGTMVSSSNTYNISVDASGPSMDPNKIAQKIVTAISREEDRRSFGRTS